MREFLACLFCFCAFVFCVHTSHEEKCHVLAKIGNGHIKIFAHSHTHAHDPRAHLLPPKSHNLLTHTHLHIQSVSVFYLCLPSLVVSRAVAAHAHTHRTWILSSATLLNSSSTSQVPALQTHTHTHTRSYISNAHLSACTFYCCN